MCYSISLCAMIKTGQKKDSGMVNYYDYIKSPAWQERRLAKLESVKRKCERCPEREGLEVHHKTYVRLGNEASEDLIVLCKSCHWCADKVRRGDGLIEVHFYKPIPDPVREAKPRMTDDRRQKEAARIRRREEKNRILRENDDGVPIGFVSREMMQEILRRH